MLGYLVVVVVRTTNDLRDYGYLFLSCQSVFVFLAWEYHYCDWGKFRRWDTLTWSLGFCFILERTARWLK